VAAAFEQCDDPNKWPAKGNCRVARHKFRNQRLPLRRCQIERHQHERRTVAADAVADAGGLALAIRQSKPWERNAIKERER
jgi:hypothetical protein